MAAIVSEDILRGIRQLRELEDRFLNESLDPRKCRSTLQDIIEGKFATTATPSWSVSPEEQIEKVSAFLGLHGGQDGFRPADIPSIPANFQSRTDTEVLLLTVMLPDKGRVKGLQRTFDAWWDFTVPPNGLAKCRWEELKSDSKHLRLAPGVMYVPGIRWVAFDPNTYQGKSPEQALAQSKVDSTVLAHVEVLVAAALFSDWVASWNGSNSPYPNLSALQLHWNTGWSGVPYLSRWDGSRQLKLFANWADSAFDHWSSPVVREC